ncbi:hypothetical protein IE53DRAFT_340599 [Violaceomyces palustris]|uniref:Uncharacterized protein n=1 Tax=Violaceomyces palustris TaxID=1673888 RepID=A0ACD0P2R2_9BASI|nr:hypothetical protein IE53DRAFT_340599 [Violaceomyces palustris]
MTGNEDEQAQSSSRNHSHRSKHRDDSHRRSSHRDRDPERQSLHRSHGDRDRNSEKRRERDGEAERVRDHRDRGSQRHQEHDHHRDRHRHRSSRRSRSRSRDREDRHERKRRRETERGEGKQDGGDSNGRKDSARIGRDTRDGLGGRDGNTIVDDQQLASSTIMNMGGEELEMNHPEGYIPTSASLSIKSRQVSSTDQFPASVPKDGVTETRLKRDDWMLEVPQADIPVGKHVAVTGRHSNADLRADGVRDGDQETETPSKDDGDFFSRLGKERQRKPKEEKPDPEKLKISSRELNRQLVEGRKLDEYDEQPQERPQYGSPGYQWRMMKLRRIYETAEEEKRPVEEVALERYESLEAFNDARAERQFLDDRDRNRVGKGGSSGRNTPIQSVARRSFMFSDSPGPSPGLGGGPPSRPSSRQSFRKPGEASAPSTPQATVPTPLAKRTSSFVQSGYETPGGKSGDSSKAGTPIPSVFTPVLAQKAKTGASADESAAGQDLNVSSAAIRSAIAASEARDLHAKPPLSADALNKLQAKVMKAELMGKENAKSLREEYERESARAKNGGDKGNGFFESVSSSNAIRPAGLEVEGEATEIQVLPTLDGRGRLYDVGSSTPGDDDQRTALLGNRRKKLEKFETRDPKTGEILRYNKDDDDKTLADLVRAERFGAGSRDQKDLDYELASRIATDSAYENDLEYMDDQAEKLARKKMKTDAMKRQFAINDFARTKKALETCIYCWQDEGSRPPKTTVISSGTRVYLAMPEWEGLTDGHCIIVPMQHHLSSLEAEDDTWDEIKNFMKCLMQMAAKKNEGVIFYETVVSLKHQKHTYIEAVPVPWDLYLDLPAYFKESILAVEEEWTQHKKLIDFSTNGKGFRRSMVPQLPYFMVQWDYKGEKGYGHVIEGLDAPEQNPDGNDYEFSQASRGGGALTRTFAAEIIGNQLDLEPRRWRKPRRIHSGTKQDEDRLRNFKARWDSFDWTKMLSSA